MRKSAGWQYKISGFAFGEMNKDTTKAVKKIHTKTSSDC